MEDKLRRILRKRFALSESDVSTLIARAPVAYKSYHIKKKNGGFRKISQPAKETKAIQHWIVDSIFSNFDVHPAATAYEKGSSIKENAARHVSNRYFVKLDFKNFFPSILKKDIEGFLKKSKIKLNEKDVSDLVRLTCIKNKEKLCLSVGAPSSPKISNVILYFFDEEISKWCKKNEITYTRYADDLTFSTKEKGWHKLIENKVLETISGIESPKLELNNSKSIFLSKKDWVSVTGINLTSDYQLSVGRKRKRAVRSMIFKHKIDGLRSDELEKLNGIISFIEHIEPGFKSKVYKKYGYVKGIKIK